jgi:hypothetical protein
LWGSAIVPAPPTLNFGRGIEARGGERVFARRDVMAHLQSMQQTKDAANAGIAYLAKRDFLGPLHAP